MIHIHSIKSFHRNGTSERLRINFTTLSNDRELTVKKSLIIRITQKNWFNPF